MRKLSLDHLTVLSLTPPEQVVLASKLGCEAVSIRVHPLPRGEIPGLDMIGDTPQRRETSRLSRDLGVEIYLVEVFMIYGHTEVESYRPALESAAALGAVVANVGCMDKERARFHDKFAAFAELAASFGVKTSIEPLGAGPMFRGREAREAVDHCTRPDAGLMTDILHLTRSGEGPEALALFEPSGILYAQLCDGPLTMQPDRIIEEAMFDRQLPGEGSFPLREFIRAIPEHVPLGVEIPMRRLERIGVSLEDRAAAAVRATRAVLSQLGK